MSELNGTIVHKAKEEDCDGFVVLLDEFNMIWCGTKRMMPSSSMIND